MQYEVINIRPSPNGGPMPSEEIGRAIADTYQRVVEAGGQIIGSHTLDVPQDPRTTQELFLVAALPDNVATTGYTSVRVGADAPNQVTL